MIDMILGFFKGKRRKKPPLDLTPYQGQWVAVKDKKVIASDLSIRALMNKLKHMQRETNGCSIWFESKPEEIHRWAVMYRDTPGRVYPNCLFKTREEAEQWMNSYSIVENHYLATREGLRTPWTEVTS
ncbi:MAG TPA: DUF5678 domain-containing protein [Candidatus Paceibacterota bacterium]